MLKIPSHLSVVLERGGTVVVPSRQRAHALGLAHAAAQLAERKQVWTTPDSLPLEGWLLREVERDAANIYSKRSVPRVLAAAEEWLLWRQCTAEATDGLDLVNRASLAESLRRASGLAADLRIDPQAGGSNGTEAGLLATVHRAVMQRCIALGAVPLPAALASVPSVGDGRPVVLAGFLAPSPRLRSIAAARAQQGFDTAYSAAGDAGMLALPRVELPADESEELERIAQWCRERLTAQADARLLILLPGSAGRRERLAALIRQGFLGQWPLATAGLDAGESTSLVAIEGGQPLASLPMVAHALGSLALLAGEALGIERFLEWLRAPWWTEPSPAARARLDLWLRERGRLRLDLASLRTVLQRVPPTLALPAKVISTLLEHGAKTVGASSGSPREWSEKLDAALRIMGWPGDPKRGSAEQQTLARFHELLEELGQLSLTTRTLPLDVAVQWLTERASLTPYRPADDDAAVTISPAYLDPVVQYDGVWVAGLNADSFPQPVAPDPFLPLPAQIAAGWPAATAAGRLEEARALVAAWRAAGAELVLSAAARAADIELLPSPLLEEWRTPAPPYSKTRASIWLPARMHRPGMLTEWRDDLGVAWSSQLPLPSGTRSLELQNQCPFRAYAELRLGSQQLGVPEPGIAPDARGQLLHAALQQLWDRLGDSRALLALSPQALDEQIGACVADAAAKLAAAGGEALPRPALARECRRTARLIRKLLDIERGRAPFRMRHTEYESRLRLAGQEVRLRIDRLDALASGGLAILDYKSGRRVTPDWYGDRPSHPQLLAYLAAVGEEVVALATVNVTAREVRFDGIAASEDLLPKVTGVKAAAGQSQAAWQSQVQEWRGLVERLAGAFAAGQAAVDPKPHACDYCHVATVCRVGDSLIAVDDDALEEGLRGWMIGVDDE
ncbi:MAG TPA: PD-(D/E)XK nuclease family protein [Steroidobacteraceae bacterium]|nr:PD-(D/E)XK nuclease family protein [Steroidobacteraceae bacterium]